MVARSPPSGPGVGHSRSSNVQFVKLLTANVNTDGLYLGGSSGVTVSDSFFLNADNMIDLGYPGSAGPSNILVQRSTFSTMNSNAWLWIQSGYNDTLPQSTVQPGVAFFQPTIIGANCTFLNNRIIRMNTPQGLITTLWGQPQSVQNLVITNLTVDHYGAGSSVCRKGSCAPPPAAFPRPADGAASERDASASQGAHGSCASAACGGRGPMTAAAVPGCWRPHRSSFWKTWAAH